MRCDSGCDALNTSSCKNAAQSFDVRKGNLKVYQRIRIRNIVIDPRGEVGSTQAAVDGLCLYRDALGLIDHSEHFYSSGHVRTLAGGAARGHSGLRVLPEDTSARGLGEAGFKPPTVC